MRRKIFLSGLTLALFVAGFAVATWPAVAELRTITVTLVGGQEIVTTVDVPPGTPANQIKLPEITAPIAGINDGSKPASPPKSDGTSGPSGPTGNTGTTGPSEKPRKRARRNSPGRFLDEANAQPVVE